MSGGLPELAVRAVQDVAADGDYPHVLLDYVSELLLRVALPNRRQLGRHVVLYAVLYQCAVRIHPLASFFFAQPSLVSGLYFRLSLLADVHYTEVVVRRLELPRYLEFLIRTGVDHAARQPRQCLDSVELASRWYVDAQLQACPLRVRLTGNASSYERQKRQRDYPRHLHAS